MRRGERKLTAHPFVPPVFGNLLRGLVQPIFVSGQTDHLDRCKPLGRILGTGSPNGVNPPEKLSSPASLRLCAVAFIPVVPLQGG